MVDTTFDRNVHGLFMPGDAAAGHAIAARRPVAGDIPRLDLMTVSIQVLFCQCIFIVLHPFPVVWRRYKVQMETFGLL